LVLMAEEGRHARNDIREPPVPNEEGEKLCSKKSAALALSHHQN